MQIRIELTETDLRRLVLEEIEKKLGDVPVTVNEVKIQVKTKKNFRANEWEDGSFRAIVEK